jgi:hypothetical protein
MDLRRVTIRDLKDAVEELGKLYHAAKKSGDVRILRPFQDFQEGRKLKHVTRSGLQVVLAPFKGGAQVVTTFWKGQPDPPPPGHCDPVALRVAARYARRTIRFDTRRVSLLGSELAERAINRLLQTLPPDTGIEWELDRQAVIVEDELALADVRGLSKPIKILVKHRTMRNDKPTAGGTYAGGEATITLYLNSGWSPAALKAELHAVQGMFASFLVHEVTHALDVLPEGDYEGGEGNLATYYNQPIEFRAFTKQIVTDVLARWKMVLRRNPRESGAALIEAALESSENYKKVKNYFDRRNHQRLRLTLLRELQDAGVMPEA